MPTKELGDPVKSGPYESETVESDGAGAAGDLVTINASGQVTPTAAADDDIYGVLLQDSPAAGEDVTVGTGGRFFANVATGVAKGDWLEASATAGQAAANAQGSTHSVDEGGTAVYRLALHGARAMSAEGGTFDGVSLNANVAAVKLP